MKILLINHYAGSPELGMEYRPHYLAKEWVSLGHEVTILAASFGHVRTNQPVVANDLDQTIINGIPYIWLLTPEYLGNGLGRIKNIFSFTNKLRKFSKIIANKLSPDIVIASSTYTLDNIYAKKIADYSKAKYIYEIHDLWPLSPMELGGFSKFHPFILIMQYGENFAYKKCDAVVSMLPNTKEHTASHGLDLQKWNYIPNGINIEEWEITKDLNAKTSSIITEIRKKFSTIVGYTGAHGPANGLNSFVKSAFDTENKNIAFVLVGKGPEKKELVELSVKSPNKNIFFLDNINKQEIPTLLSLFDFLYIGLKNEALFRFGISPNKLIDYMMAGKPVIQAISAGNDPAKESGCGLSISPESPEEITTALQELKSFSLEKLAEMGKNGQTFVKLNHNYKILSKNFIKVMEGVIG